MKKKYLYALVLLCLISIASYANWKKQSCTQEQLDSSTDTGSETSLEIFPSFTFFTNI